MNICVVGAGAIGGWIAARLALAGNDVSVVARGETLRAIETEGLWITDGGDTRCVAVAAAEDPSALGVHGVVVIAVKAPALPAIASSLEALIGPETQIVPMLNGVPWWFTDDPLWSVDPGCDHRRRASGRAGRRLRRSRQLLPERAQPGHRQTCR